jgi:hypothetical protein
MLRLSLVFLVWMGSTAYALENRDTDYEIRLHEAFGLVWNEADDEERDLLAGAQRGRNAYRAATCALLGEDCYVVLEAHWCGVLTDADVHTILPPDEIADGFLGRP